MLLDNDGDAVFIYTPPSSRSRSVSKARDPRHAAKLYAEKEKDTTGEWECFTFSSLANPTLKKSALDRITRDMTRLAYEQEIMAEDKDHDPDALWTPDLIAANRVDEYPELSRLVVGVDPPGGATECGIVAAGLGPDGHAYVLDDASLKASPETWGSTVVAVYEQWGAGRVLGEANYGGDMVEYTIKSVEGGESVSYKAVKATRGKAVRAEPVAARYERGMVHHVDTFPNLEDEMVTWVPGAGMPSPNRLDALVWCIMELLIKPRRTTLDFVEFDD
jgi:phage terminase large subunit-like protein